MATRCNKFIPNMFNKNKCQSCFKSKEQHSAEALENSKVARKVSKCAYLFVAPDFDFSNPLQRTRRWQRRFFVLYDDGELTYSVDENASTVPQGVIDMNKCTDVYDAENVTSHQYSIAVETPSKITYIKGTCKEEINRWYDVLVMYPRSIVAKHRRSPTHPPTSTVSTRANQDSDMIVAVVGSQAPISKTTEPVISAPSSSDASSTRRRAYSSKEPTTIPHEPLTNLNSLDRSNPRVKKGFQPYDSKDGLSLRDNGMEHLRNNSRLGAIEASRNYHESEPQTYRGVRSMKRKAGSKSSHSEGLRKSNSLHDLSSSPESLDSGGSSDSVFTQSKYISKSKDNLADSVSYETRHWRRKSDSHLGSMENLEDSHKPRTLFETLLHSEPSKPKTPVTKHDRYKKLASIPHTKPIEDYVSYEEKQLASMPATSQSERRRKSSVTRSNAYNKERWKSDGFVGFTEPKTSLSDHEKLDRNGIGKGGDGLERFSTEEYPTSSRKNVTEKHSPIYARKFNKTDAVNSSTPTTTRRHTTVIGEGNVNYHETPSKSHLENDLDLPYSSDSSDYSSRRKSKSEMNSPVSYTSNKSRYSHVSPPSRSAKDSVDHPITQSRRIHFGSPSQTIHSPQRVSESPQSPNQSDENQFKSHVQIGRRLIPKFHKKADDLTYMKKGWLLKQLGNSDKDWKKFWFVLSGSALKFYNDSRSEDSSQIEGHIDLTPSTEVSEVTVSRNYGFTIENESGKQTFSAMTCGIRNNWMQAVKKCIDSVNDKYNTSASSDSPVFRSRQPQNAFTSISVEARTNGTNRTNKRTNKESDRLSLQEISVYEKKPPSFTLDDMHEIDVIEQALRDMENISKFDPREDSKAESTLSNGEYEPHTLRQHEPSASRFPQKTQNIDKTDYSVSLTAQEENELGHVEQNMREMGRRSVGESSQKEKPKIMDRLERQLNEVETATVSQPVIEKNQSVLSLRREDKHLKSSTDSIDSIGTTSSETSLSPRKLSRSVEGGLNYIRSKSPSNPRAPSAKVKDRSRSKSPRPKSPPPEMDIDDLIDKMLEVTEEGEKIQESSKKVRSRKYSTDALLVDLLDTQVESLKSQLENTQRQLSHANDLNFELKLQLADSDREHRDSLNEMENEQTSFLDEMEGIQQKMDKRTESSKFQIQSLKKQLKETNAINLKQENEIAELKSKRDISVKELSDIQQSLKESVRNLDSERQQAEQTSKQCRAQVQTLQDQLDEKSHKLTELEKHQKENAAQLQQSQTDVQQKMQQISKLEQQLKEMTQSNNELTEKYKLVEELSAEVELYKQRLAEEECKLRQVEDDFDEQLKSVEEDYERENERLQGQLYETEKKLEEALKKSNVSDSQNTENLKRKDERIEQLEKHVTELSKTIEKLRTEQSQKKSSFDAELTSITNRKDTKIRELENQLRKSGDRIAELLKVQAEAANDSVKSNMPDILKEKQEEIAQLEVKLSESESKMEELMEELNAEVEENGRVHQQLDDLFDTNGALKHEVVELKKRLQDLQIDYDELSSEQENTQIKSYQIESLQAKHEQELALVEKKKQDLEKENADVKKVLADYRNQFEDWVIRCDQKDNEIKTLRSEIENQAKSKSESQHETEVTLAALKKKLAEMEKKELLSEESKVKLANAEQTWLNKEKHLLAEHEDCLVELNHTKSKLQTVEERLQWMSSEADAKYDELLNKYNKMAASLDLAQKESAEWKGQYERSRQEVTTVKSSRQTGEENLNAKLKDLQLQLQEKEKDFKDQIKSLNSQCERLTAELEKSESQVRALTESLNMEQENNNKNKVVHDDITSELETAKETISQLHSEVEELRKELVERDISLCDSQKSLQENQRTLQVSQKSLQQCQRSLDDSQLAQCQTQTALQACETALQESKQSEQTLQQKVEELMESQQKKTSMQSLQRCKKDSVSILPAHDVDVETLIAENSKTAEKHKTALEDIRSLQKKLTDVCNSHDDTELKYTSLQQRYDGLKQDSEDQIHLMGKRVEDLTNKLTAAEGMIRQLESKLSQERNKTQSDVQNLLDHMSTTVNGVEMTIATQDTKQSDLIKRLDAVEKMFASATASKPECSPEKQTLSPSSGSVLRMSAVQYEMAGSGGVTDSDSESGTANKAPRISILKQKLDTMTEKLRKTEEELEALKTKLQDEDGSQSTDTEECLRADNELYLREIERLKAELHVARDHGSELSKDRGVADLSNHLQEVDIKLGQTQSTLDDCRNKLTDVIQELGSVKTATSRENYTSTIENIRDRLNDILAEVSHLPGELQRGDRLHSGKDRHDGDALTLHVPKNRLCYLKEDEKLRLYAEKLALEAVIMGEMAYLVQTGQDRFTSERELFFQEIQEARAEISHLEDQVMGLLSVNEPGTQTQMPKSMKDSVSMYASLLAEKMVLEGQLTSVLKSAGGDECRQTVISDTRVDQTCTEMAFEAIAGSRISEKMSRDCDSLTKPDSISAQMLAEGELQFMLGRLQRGSLESLSPAEKTDFLEQRLQAAQLLLREQQTKMSHLIASFKRSKIEELARLMASETIRDAVHQTGDVDAEAVSDRVISAMRSYADLYESKMVSSEQKRLLVQESIETEIESVENDLRRKYDAVSEDFNTEGVSFEPRSPVEQINTFADIMVQQASIGGILSYLTEKLSNQVTAEVESPAQSSCDSAQYLAEQGSTRQAIAEKLKCGDVHSCQQVSALASEIIDIDLTLPKYRTSISDYADTIAREAVFQAQMTYMTQKLSAQYEQKITDLQSQINVQNEASANITQTDYQNELEHLSLDKFEMEKAEKHTRNESASSSDHHLEELTELRKQCEEREITIKALKEEKDKINIDMEEKVATMEKEISMWKTKYHKAVEEAKECGLLESEVKEYEEQIESLEDEMDSLNEHYQQEIENLRAEISMKEAELVNVCEKLADSEDLLFCIVSENEVDKPESLPSGASESDLSQKLSELKERYRNELDEIQQLKMGRKGTGMKALKADEADSETELESEVTLLKEQLADEQTRHLEELNQLKRQLASNQDVMSHMQESNPDIQEDYDQELLIEREAHKRELARTKEEMMQLLAEGGKGEEISSPVTDESVRKKYEKEIEKLKELCNKGFTNMENSYSHIIDEMSVSHRKEIERLRLERDEMLSEETRATQSDHKEDEKVLDTMRKAHEAELQEEKTKLDDALNQLYSTGDAHALYVQHQQEMALIKEELDRLSEQYSMKCVENAELTERLQNRTHSLQESRRYNHQLAAKNEELNLKLKDEISQMKQEVAKELSVVGSSPQQHHPALQRLKELEESEERYHDIYRELHEEKKKHQSDIDELRHQLDDITEASSFFSDEDEDNDELYSVGSGTPESERSASPEQDDVMDDTAQYSPDKMESSTTDSVKTTASGTKHSTSSAALERSSPERSSLEGAQIERSSPEERPIIPAINMLERRKMFHK